MSEHKPLPSDPVAKAAEKKRRFKVYQKDWKKRRRETAARVAIADFKASRALLADARRVNLDLCLTLDDMGDGQLRKALQTARSWIS